MQCFLKFSEILNSLEGMQLFSLPIHMPFCPTSAIDCRWTISWIQRHWSKPCYCHKGPNTSPIPIYMVGRTLYSLQLKKPMWRLALKRATIVHHARLHKDSGTKFGWLLNPFLAAGTLISSLCDLTHAHCAWLWSSMIESTHMINTKCARSELYSSKSSHCCCCRFEIQTKIIMVPQLQQRMPSSLTWLNNQYGIHIHMNFKK